jgi:hypothetical protein
MTVAWIGVDHVLLKQLSRSDLAPVGRTVDVLGPQSINVISSFEQRERTKVMVEATVLHLQNNDRVDVVVDVRSVATKRTQRWRRPNRNVCRRIHTIGVATEVCTGVEICGGIGVGVAAVDIAVAARRGR